MSFRGILIVGQPFELMERNGTTQKNQTYPEFIKQGNLCRTLTFRSFRSENPGVVPTFSTGLPRTGRTCHLQDAASDYDRKILEKHLASGPSPPHLRPDEVTVHNGGFEAENGKTTVHEKGRVISLGSWQAGKQENQGTNKNVFIWEPFQNQEQCRTRM